MGSLLSNVDGHCAREKANVGIAVTSQELLGRDEQVDAMVCDPISVPSTSACTEGGEENCKERGNCVAPGETNAGRLPPITPSSNGMFNNVVNYGFQSNLSDFVSFFLRFPAGDENNFHEHRNFGMTAVVRFLEDRNAELMKAASQRIAELHLFYGSQVTMLTDKHEKQVIGSESRSQGKILELSSDLEKVSKELSDAQVQLKSTSSGLNSAQSEIEDMRAQRKNFELELRHSKGTVQVLEQKVHRLRDLIEEKEKSARDMEASTCQLTSECKKLKDQLAKVEQSYAQESLTSGSYADGHVNPSMLEIACKDVDKATDVMARFVHEKSITSKSSLKEAGFESFIGKISPARPADFSRLVQVKHVWGHWICAKMFQGFEHVFFDIDRERSSPLDFKLHASECFQRFQQKKDVSPSEYYKACAMFQAFCIEKYKTLFPVNLVHEGLQLDSTQTISCDRDGGFDIDDEFHLKFLEVAKAIWLLHGLAFAFDPPASILRMSRGTRFDKQYHESLIKDADNDEMSAQVVLMIRPAFRVRNITIKSRVFLSTK